VLDKLLWNVEEKKIDFCCGNKRRLYWKDNIWSRSSRPNSNALLKESFTTTICGNTSQSHSPNSFLALPHVCLCFPVDKSCLRARMCLCHVRIPRLVPSRIHHNTHHSDLGSTVDLIWSEKLRCLEYCCHLCESLAC
jgi:hypothetical protein